MARGIDAAEADAPNIVVIMADDLGWMDLHCQGNQYLDTPNVDRLAGEGMRFTDAYAAAPVCTPTRAAMMTGQAPARLAITNHAPGHGPRFRLEGSDLIEASWNTYLALDYVTIAERLKQSGYATGFIGKWHLSHRRGKDEQGPYEPRLRPQWQGFDLNVGGCGLGGPPSYFEPYKIPNITPKRNGDYLPDRLADEAIQFLRSHRDERFFLSWWPYSVHYPIQAPQRLIDKYRNRKGAERPEYLAMIEGMDLAVGRFLAALDDCGLTDNTLLVFTSDNGSLFSNLPLRQNKGYLYEGGLRVPWIVRWPGRVAPNSVCATPVVSMDIYPTIVEVAGLGKEPDRQIDGLSILPLLRQAGTWDREAIYFHYPNYAFHKQNRLGSAVRVEDYKLIHYYDDDSVELYNLADDLGESRNLAETSPDVAAAMKMKLDAWLKDVGAKLPTRVSN
jgi:arylsulfatase A